MKECCRCKVEKELSDFDRLSVSKDGRRATCKSCMKQYRTENKAVVDAQQKRYAIDNKEKRNEKSRLHYQANKEKYAEWSKRYRQKNKDKIAEDKKRYNAENKEKINAHKKKRRTEDLCLRLVQNMRSRTRLVLNGASKSASTSALLGCSPQEFRDYMESKFTDGMTWDNYGMHGWHMDHITPLSIFNMKNPAEQHIAFHHRNLQPMWAKDNLKKGNKVS